MSGYLHISLVILSGLLGWSLWKRTPRLTGPDIAVLGILLYDCLSLPFSIYFPASLCRAEATTLAVCFYLCVRFYAVSPRPLRFLPLATSSLAGPLAFIASVGFLMLEKIIRESWPADIYELRYLYRPFELLASVWNALLIPFLGFIALGLYYHRRNRSLRIILSLAACCIIFCTVTSFSRGVYLSSAILWCGLIVLLLRSRSRFLYKTAVICVLSAAIAIPAAIYHQEFLKTLRFNETPSQQRSIQGRINANGSVWLLLEDHPVTGTGSGNYVLTVNPLIFEDDNHTFTDFAPNTPVELAIEKGILGILVWTTAIVLFLWSFIKSGKKSIPAWIIFFTLLAVFVRELTFSVFFHYPGYQLIVFSLLAIGQTILPACTALSQKRLPAIPRLTLSLLPVLTAMTFIILQSREERNRKLEQACADAIENGDADQAGKMIRQIGNTLPNRHNISALYHLLYRQTGDTSALFSARQVLHEIIRRNPYDPIPEYNLALLAFEQGDTLTAQATLTRLTARYPNNTLFQTSLYRVLYANGQWQKAIPYLVKAIQLTPALLNSDLWLALRRHDLRSSDNVIRKLQTYIPENIQNPIVQAKYGRILLSLGDTAAAKIYLTQSVTSLPNLSQPWLYLGVIALLENDTSQSQSHFKRVRLLNPNDTLTKYYSQRRAAPVIIPPANHEDLLFANYYLKFETWYGICPPSNIIFGYPGQINISNTN